MPPPAAVRVHRYYVMIVMMMMMMMMMIMVPDDEIGCVCTSLNLYTYIYMCVCVCVCVCRVHVQVIKPSPCEEADLTKVCPDDGWMNHVYSLEMQCIHMHFYPRVNVFIHLSLPLCLLQR